MTMTRKIHTRGHSASLTLPKTILEVLGVDIGDSIEFEIVGGAVVMYPENQDTALQRARRVSLVAQHNLEKLLLAAPLGEEANAEEAEAILATERRGRRD